MPWQGEDTDSLPVYSEHVDFEELRQPEIRKWRDVFFTFVFYLCFLTTTIVAIVAYTKGDPKLFHTVGESWDWLGFSFVQLYELRWILLASIFVSASIALLWVQLLKSYTRGVVYGSVLACIILYFAAGIFMVVHAVQWDLSYLLWMGIGILVTGVFLCVILCCFRTRLHFSIAVIQEGCRGLQYNPMLIVVGLGLMTVLIGLFILWVLSMPFLFTIPISTGLGFDISPRGIAFFMIFGMFYTFRVICAVFESTVGGAVSHWYFSRNPYAREAQQMSPSLSALRFSLTKSFGSLALGALIIAAFDFVNLLLRLTEKKSTNRVVRCVLSAFRCVLNCLQSLAQAVNRYAFVYVGMAYLFSLLTSSFLVLLLTVMGLNNVFCVSLLQLLAMTGEGFCDAGRRVLDLVTRNGLSLWVLDRLCWLTMFVGRLLGMFAGIITTIAIYMYQEQALSPVPLIMSAVAAYCVFYFTSMLVTGSVNTVFICYMHDIERNRDTGHYYATTEMHEVMQALKK